MTLVLLQLRSRCPAVTTAAATGAASKLESLFGLAPISQGRTGSRPASTASQTATITQQSPSSLPSKLRLHASASAQNRRPQSLHLRHFHCTTSALEKSKDAEKATPTETELAETEETVPEWQNPLHHNNPEMNKMFEEDFQEGQDTIVPAPLPPFETDPEKVVAPPHGESIPVKSNQIESSPVQSS
jgi:hypothetical protein